MRLFLILTTMIGFLTVMNSCGNSQKNKDTTDKVALKKVDTALRDYFLQKNASSEYHTEIEFMKPISIEKIATEKPDEEYKADVYLKAKIRMIHGSRVYNVNDTIECYLNKNFEVQRTENKPSENEE